MTPPGYAVLNADERGQLAGLLDRIVAGRLSPSDLALARSFADDLRPDGTVEASLPQEPPIGSIAVDGAGTAWQRVFITNVAIGETVTFWVASGRDDVTWEQLHHDLGPSHVIYTGTGPAHFKRAS